MSAVFDRLMPDEGRRPLDADEALAAEMILDAAEHYAAGKLPWWEAANIGPVPCLDSHGREIHSPQYGRYVALMVAYRTDDPRKEALLQLIDELIDQSGVTVTPFGIIDVEELHQHNITVRTRAA
jgi:hypothetical protein